MPTASEILADPNYINANAATKAAIFSKHIASLPDFVNANPATQQAITARFGLGAPDAPAAAPVTTGPRPTGTIVDRIPGADGPGPAATSEPTLYQKVRPWVAPSVEALGATGGALVGAPLGPAGAVAGAGLGYGAAKEALKLADIHVGGMTPAQAQTEPVKNVLMGATMEAGGQAVVPLLSKGVSAVVGKIADMRQIPAQKAAEIARDTLGADLPLIVDALRNAPPGVSAAQATAHIPNPTWQALLDRASKSNPEAVKFMEILKRSQGDKSLNALAELAGGTTQTAAKANQLATKEVMRDNLIPTLNIELNAANTAGKVKPVLDAEAKRMADAATAKVEDVRRFTAAAPRAEALARTNLIERGLPVGAAKYTYTGELGKKAEQVAERAAEASLPFGEAARFAQSASESLAAHGLKPLEIAPVVAKLQSIAGKSEYAGNDIIEATVKQLSDDLAKWSNSGGVIDAFALDAIRKNSVNAVVQKMRPTLDATAQKKLAASVINDVKPAIADAIEAAGGTGYKAYLSAWSEGMHGISQQKLAAKALDLYKTSPDKFRALVDGDNIKEIEKIFGPGSYDIAKEMGAKSMTTLEKVAKGLATDASVAEQATLGQPALRTLLMANMSKWRLPSYLSVVSSTTNKALDIIESRIGTKTMEKLAKAAKSGKNAADLLESLPATERNKVLQIMSNPENWIKVPMAGTVSASKNALAPDKKPQNAMVQ